MDKRVAKLNVFLIVIYTLFYKKLSNFVLFLYLLLGLFAMCAVYKSHHYSTQEWCCDEHLFNHSLIHIAGLFGILYVFL